MHRFGSYLNSHVHFHVLVTDGVFSPGDDGQAVFHPALDLERADVAEVQTKMRHRPSLLSIARRAAVRCWALLLLVPNYE